VRSSIGDTPAAIISPSPACRSAASVGTLAMAAFGSDLQNTILIRIDKAEPPGSAGSGLRPSAPLTWLFQGLHCSGLLGLTQGSDNQTSSQRIVQYLAKT